MSVFVGVVIFVGVLALTAGVRDIVREVRKRNA